MSEKPITCQGCPLYEKGIGFARTDGTGRNGVLLLGEALGESEAEASKPFVGDAGMMLNRVLHRGSLKREDFLIANVVNCRPPNNWLDGAPWEAAAIHHCDQYLTETLRNNPHIKVVVPLGNVPLRTLTGHSGVKNFHGTVHWNDRFKVWVVPSLHPSFILRTGWKEFPTSLFDINLAVKVAREGFERSDTRYIEHPKPETLEQFANEYEAALGVDKDLILAADIETDFSSTIDEEDLLEKDDSWTITRISFAFKPNEAITVPFTSQYRDGIVRLLSTTGQKVFWNGHKFDVPRLRRAGIPVQGRVIDGMDAWHVFRSDLPKGLGYVSPFFTDLAPWKHLSAERPEFYSCVDSDALIRIILKLREAMRKDGSWDYFLSHWTNLEPRLRAMSEVGVGVDEPKRAELEAKYIELRDNCSALVQEHVPESLKNRVKGKEHGYKGKPKDVRSLCKELGITKGQDDSEAWLKCGYKLFPYKEITVDAEGRESQVEVQRWDKLEDFNPGSPQQIIRYIESKYGRGSVPRDKRTGNPTTGLEELERLAKAKKDKVLELIIGSSEADSHITSFIRPWKPGPDGRIHGIFTNAPATPRLASQNPNLQNFPRRSDEASLMRQMIVPGEGFQYLWELDYKSIEAILVGYYANDPLYTKIAYLGIHDFMSGKKLGLDLRPDMGEDELRAGIKEGKKLGNSTKINEAGLSVRDACKVSVHGGNYLQGALLLHKTYPEIFPRVRDAQEYQEFYFGIFPKIPVWQKETIDQAYDVCHVANAWNIKRWLWNVKRWSYSARKAEWELVNGEDAKKAVANNPQGSAGMIMRGALVSDPAQELIDRGCLMVTIHDSLLGRARDKRELDWCIETGIRAMEYKIMELGGIVIPVEAKVGPTWGAMEELKR